MKIAVPTANKKLTAHFGHCELFAIVYTDGSTITKTEYINPPVHQPGVYPRFLADQGVEVIIAGGMGQKAQDLFAANNIKVYMGVNTDDPENLVQQYLSQELKTGENQCTH